MAPACPSDPGLGRQEEAASVVCGAGSHTVFRPPSPSAGSRLTSQRLPSLPQSRRPCLLPAPWAVGKLMAGHLGSGGPRFFPCQLLPRGGKECSGNQGVAGGGWGWAPASWPPGAGALPALHPLPSQGRGSALDSEPPPRVPLMQEVWGHTHVDEERQMLPKTFKDWGQEDRAPREKPPQAQSSRPLHTRGWARPSAGERSALPRGSGPPPAPAPTAAAHRPEQQR